MEAITTALGTAFKTVSDGAMDAIGTGIPYALPIVGAVIVVTVAVKAFKAVANK